MVPEVKQSPWEVASVAAFISQVCRLVTAKPPSQHFFYATCYIRNEKKLSRAWEIDQKYAVQYGCNLEPWQRKSRYRGENAGIHYMRCKRLITFLLTHGKHDDFYRDHGKIVKDIRITPLKAFGYEMKSVVVGNSRCFRVQLDKEVEQQIHYRMLSLAVRPEYRDAKTLEKEFKKRLISLHRGGRLRSFEILYYGAVHAQLREIVDEINSVRRRKRLALINKTCIPVKRRLPKVFEHRRTSEAA